MKLNEVASTDLDYVYDNYYVWGEEGDRIIIEESKAKYEIYFDRSRKVVDVSPYNEIANQTRAREIINEIKSRKDLGYERP